MSNGTPEQTSFFLGSAAAMAEQGFLAVGQSLEGAVELLDRLIHRFAAYVEELTGGALDETGSGLSMVSSQVAALADTHRSDMGMLASLGDIVAATGRRLVALQPITQEVQMLALSARLVAGSMSTSASEFLGFSRSIEDAADRTQDSLQHLQNGLGRVDEELRTVRAMTAAFACRHGASMQEIPTRLDMNLQSLRTQQQQAGDAAVEARRRSEEVRRQVAEQIVALQLGDITRQRVEHVQEAGRRLEPNGSSCELPARLLAAQLSDTADELAREGQRIEVGLTQLAAAACAIGQLGAQVHAGTAGRTGGFIAALEADIEQTAALFAELRTEEADTDKRMAAVLDAAGQLAGRLATVQSAEEDIRIMGLNATLRCGRLGVAGRPLAAVAQELRGCSGRFAGDAAAALRDLETLRSIVASLRDPMRDAKQTALAAAMDGMLAALRRLKLLEHELVSALAQLQSDAEEVGRLVESAVTQFSVRHALEAMLRQAAEAFASSTPEIENASAVSATVARNVLDGIATGYTMAREREVHARFAPLPLQPTTVPLAADADELADILF